MAHLVTGGKFWLPRGMSITSRARATSAEAYCPNQMYARIAQHQ
jgi:hypothetical protein